MRRFNITVNGKTYEVDVEEIGGAVTAPIAAPIPVVSTAAPQTAPTSNSSEPVQGATQVLAPMPGNIFKINVNVGDMVKKGDVVIVLEAMKMENEIFSDVDGKVVGIRVNTGDSVNTGDVLVSIG